MINNPKNLILPNLDDLQKETDNRLFFAQFPFSETALFLSSAQRMH